LSSAIQRLRAGSKQSAPTDAESKMDLGIAGLRVIVTAGAAGIGREVARTFMREGARVYVCDVDQTALEALATSDPKLSASLCDVADRDAVTRFFDQAVRHLGGLDCLINNAGIAGPTGRVDEIPPEDWDRTLAVNITGQFNCARAAVRHLAESRNPSIINLSSAAGRFGFPLRTPYAASKWAVVGFTKSLAMELGPLNIRVNAIQPGIVEGDRIRRVFGAKAQVRGVSLQTIQEESMSHASIKEMISPQQLADMMVFLASPRGRTISGQAISICGDLQSLA
jgi:NAD(P)-dependent dehydrogenase (short-subunit alcohol dehydrogenase family)